MKAIKDIQRAKADREENAGVENTTEAGKRWWYLENTKGVQALGKDEELEEPIPTEELMREIQEERDTSNKIHKRKENRRIRDKKKKTVAKKKISQKRTHLESKKQSFLRLIQLW